MIAINDKPKHLKTDKPNPRQQRFIDAWLITGNATQSAKNAGYSEASAHVQGYLLLRNDKIKAAIDARIAELAGKCDVTEQEIIQALRDEAFNKEGTFARDRIRAIELLAKIKGMLSEHLRIDIEVIKEFTQIEQAEAHKLAKLRLHDRLGDNSTIINPESILTHELEDMSLSTKDE